MASWEDLLEQGTQAEVPSGLSYKSDRQLVKWDFELVIPLVAEGAVVNYQFGTDGHDIAFGMTSVNAAGETTEILPMSRVASHVEPVTGKFGPYQGESGVLKLSWDNSYAWFNSKELSYSITVEYPDDKTVHQTEVAHDKERLTRCLEDISRAERRQRRARESCARTAQEVKDLEAKVAALQREIALKTEATAGMEQEDAFLTRRIAAAKCKASELALTLAVRDGWVELGKKNGSNGQGATTTVAGAAATAGAPAEGSSPALPPITDEDMDSL